MKNLILSLFLLSGLGVQAQTQVFDKLRSVISSTHPEIISENKLLAFNVWSMNDIESREANKSFDKVYSVYEFAKLKGGPKGIVVVAIYKDNQTGMATITFGKDGVRKLISLENESFKDIDLSGTSNMIFNSSGQIIHKNLAASEIFSSVNQLITR